MTGPDNPDYLTDDENDPDVLKSLSELKRDLRRLKWTAGASLLLVAGSGFYFFNRLENKLDNLTNKMLSEINILEDAVQMFADKSNGSFVGMKKAVLDVKKAARETIDGLDRTERYVGSFTYSIYSKLYGFEQNPAKWAILGIPAGSQLKHDRVLTPVESDTFDFTQPIQPVTEGNPYLTGIRVGKGWYWAEAGKPINVKLLGDEMRALENGFEIPYQVACVQAGPGGQEKIVASYKGGFVSSGNAPWRAANSVAEL